MSKQYYRASTYRAQSSVGYLIKRALSLMLDAMEPALEAHGFTFVQYQIMAERGLLERSRRDRDRRKVELELTADGRKVIESLVPLVVDKLNLALSDFSSDEVRELTRLLLKLNVTLQSTVEPAASVEA
jgi:hypothetical protein